MTGGAPYLEMWYYASEETAPAHGLSRRSARPTPRHGFRHRRSQLPRAGALVTGPAVPIAEFVKTHKRFWLYSFGSTWAERTLRLSGATLTLWGREAPPMASSTKSGCRTDGLAGSPSLRRGTETAVESAPSARRIGGPRCYGICSRSGPTTSSCVATTLILVITRGARRTRRPSPARCSARSPMPAAARSQARRSPPPKRKRTSSVQRPRTRPATTLFASLLNGTYAVETELQGFKKVVRPGVKVDVNTTIRVDMKLEVGQMNEAVSVVGRVAAPPDRPDRHRPPHRVEDGDRHPAHLQPQLPEHPRHRPGLHASAPRALAVLQLAGLAGGRGERTAAARQQHAHRGARQQPQDRAAAGDHPGRRRARNGQRLDQQLRRGVRPVGRRGDQRHAQVGHQRSAGQRVLLRQHRRDDGQRSAHAASKRRPSSPTAAPRSAARSCATSCSSSATTSARSTTAATSSAPRSRRMAMRNGDFSAVAQRIYDPFTGNVDGTGRVAFANNQIPQDRISPIARRLLAFLPEPNFAGATLGQNNYREGADARKDHRRLRRQGQSHAERAGSDVVPRELHAAGGVRSRASTASTAAPPTAASPAPAPTPAAARRSTGRGSSAPRPCSTCAAA